MSFNTIFFDSWKRRDMFYYFSKMAPTGYSITVEIDITILVEYLKKHNLKFFPTYLWLVTKCINKQEEFKIAYEEGKLGYYDSLTPLYATFHDDDKTFSLMWTEYDDDYEVFYNSYLNSKKEYGDYHGVLSKPNMLPPKNAYTISTVPWISFKHFAVHSYENKEYYFPSIEAGKIYNNTEGKKILPLSLTCHHATTDGYHIKRFLADLEIEMMEFIKNNRVV